MLRRLFGVLVGLAVQGFFESGWRNTRLSPALLKLALAATSLALVYLHGVLGALLAIASISTLMLLSGEILWTLALQTLSLAPAAWASISSLAMSLLGVSPITPWQALAIFVRFYAATIAIAYGLSTLNPYELYTITSKLLGREKAFTILLIHRILPHGLTVFKNALEVNSIKRDPIAPSIAAATAALLEEANETLTATTWRNKLTTSTRAKYSQKWTLAELTTLTILLLALQTL